MTNGEIIRSYRKRKKLTIKELAQKVGVSEQAISQYERSLRTPHIVILHKIACILQIPMEHFSLKLPVTPAKEQATPERNLELSNQINTYIKSDDKLKVKMMCKMLEFFHYDIEINNDVVVIIDKIAGEPYATLPKDNFAFMSGIIFSQTQGLINNLPNTKLAQQPKHKS